MDARLVGRVLDAMRTVNPAPAVSASKLDLDQPPAAGSVRVQVAARLADGTFRVLIDGKALKLALPADIKAGDVLQLRVADGEAAAALAQGSASGIPGKGLSDAGQLVANLVTHAPAAPTRQTEPVLAVPPEHPADLPEPLARAVERSGLFYESHQARWVNGDYPLASLLREPQAQAGRPEAAKPEAMPLESAAEPAPAPASGTAAAAAAADEAEAGGDPKPLVAAEAADTDPRIADKGSELVARETLAIVRQQLDTLETRHLTWLGELWPGQTMRWTIGEDAGAQHDSHDPAREWNSRFTLDLPALGSIGAELVLAGNRLRIRVSAADAATVALMRAAGPQLGHALEAAGIEPAAFEVQHREPAV
jgi:hypothetical protein